MKLGVLTVPLGGLPLEEACRFLAEQGVQMVEIGCGGFPGKAHCDAAALLADDAKCRELLDAVHKNGLEISALSSHGNMIHPDPAVAAMYEKDFTNAILLGETLISPAADGLNELTLSNAAYLSQWTRNGSVALPLDGAAFDALLDEHAANSMTHEDMAQIPDGEYQERWQTRW